MKIADISEDTLKEDQTQHLVRDTNSNQKLNKIGFEDIFENDSEQDDKNRIELQSKQVYRKTNKAMDNEEYLLSKDKIPY